MATQQTPFLMKILSGSNAGASVRLKVGEIVIGRSMSSDIILHDESIADTHLRLKVFQDTIQLEILSPPVLIDNREVEAGKVLLKPFQVVTLGDVDFFIADPRKPGQRTGEAGGDDNTIDAVAFDRSSVTGAQTVSEADQPGGVSINKAGKKSRGGVFFLLLGLGLLLAANIFYFLPNLLNFAEQVGLRESPREKAEAIVSTLDIDNLKVEGGHRAAVISGYVDTIEEKRKIMTRVGLTGGEGVNYRIWSHDELVTNAERVAHALGQVGIRFKALQEGRLEAQGYVSNGEDWKRIKVNIMDDVNGIRTIEDDGIQTLLKRKQALEQFIEKKGLSSRIRVTIEDNRVKVNGELTRSELNRWSDLYIEFQELHGKGPAIIENLYNARDRIKLVIRSVSVGDTPFLVSKGGKKYMEGSSLGNNYFIKMITPDHVLLSNNGVEIPIYYGVEDK
ncbi:hypothetical protein ACH42_00200 [Endozoicomonas sp. (ex Bugula neritina AB1)]|nr:hypothetical protein ACH42_00200 [Endozoicomonas sp. (ex Bugula neritina AB1)]